MLTTLNSLASLEDIQQIMKDNAILEEIWINLKQQSLEKSPSQRISKEQQVIRALRTHACKELFLKELTEGSHTLNKIFAAKIYSERKLKENAFKHVTQTKGKLQKHKSEQDELQEQQLYTMLQSTSKKSSIHDKMQRNAVQITVPAYKTDNQLNQFQHTDKDACKSLLISCILMELDIHNQDDSSSSLFTQLKNTKSPQLQQIWQQIEKRQYITQQLLQQGSTPLSDDIKNNLIKDIVEDILEEDMDALQRQAVISQCSYFSDLKSSMDENEFNSQKHILELFEIPKESIKRQIETLSQASQYLKLTPQNIESPEGHMILALLSEIDSLKQQLEELENEQQQFELYLKNPDTYQQEQLSLLQTKQTMNSYHKNIRDKVDALNDDALTELSQILGSLNIQALYDSFNTDTASIIVTFNDNGSIQQLGNYSPPPPPISNKNTSTYTKN